MLEAPRDTNVSRRTLHSFVTQGPAFVLLPVPCMVIKVQCEAQVNLGAFHGMHHRGILLSSEVVHRQVQSPHWYWLVDQYHSAEMKVWKVMWKYLTRGLQLVSAFSNFKLVGDRLGGGVWPLGPLEMSWTGVFWLLCLALKNAGILTFGKSQRSRTLLFSLNLYRPHLMK